MTRMEALRAVYDQLDGCAVVTIMGAVAAELQSLGHRDNTFYLQHAMGLASSVGLGIALSRPDVPVVVFDGDGSVLMNLGGLTTLGRYRPANLLHVVFDGDGSVLMNLGGLTTLGRYRPANLVHVVFDNESLLSVGGFPTATGTGTNLAGVAAAAGVPRTAEVRTLEAFTAAFDAARGSGVLTTIVAKVDATGPAAFVTDLGLLENRFQFQRYLRRR